MIARLIIGANSVEAQQQVDAALGKYQIRAPHPDILHFQPDVKLGIEQARLIKGFFAQKPYSAPGRIVVVRSADNLTDEAQNALLKTVEELTSQNQLLLIAQSDAALLPTLVSRCEVVNLSKKSVADDDPAIQDKITSLLQADSQTRFEIVEQTRNKEQLLLALLHFFHQQLPKHTEFAKELLTAEIWSKQNVQLRPILEYLMLKMPKNT